VEDPVFEIFSTIRLPVGAGRGLDPGLRAVEEKRGSDAEGDEEEEVMLGLFSTVVLLVGALPLLRKDLSVLPIPLRTLESLISLSEKISGFLLHSSQRVSGP
jgi:hypothetical protein